MADKALYYEGGQTVLSSEALTDSGDHQDFNCTAELLSADTGKTPTVYANGVKSGGIVSVAASESDDVVDVTEATVYLNGVETTVSADTDLSIPRPSTSAYQKLSVTVDSGGSWAIVEGSEGAAWSTTRNGTGGPAYIPTTSVEVAQIWYNSTSSAAVAASEIFQTENVHREMAFNPMPEVKYSRVSSGALGYAGVYFPSALPLIHTGGVAKKVYIEGYEPVFTELQDVRDFSHAQESGSTSSETFYKRSKGATSTTLNAGSFEFSPTDGVRDDILQRDGRKLWFKFYPDDTDTNTYVLQQAEIYFDQSFVAEGVDVISASLNAEEKGERVYA